MSSSLLASRIAVVTGGGSGIGKTICQVLASHGARVIVADLQESVAQETVNEIGPEHKAFSCDVSKPDSVEALQDFTFKLTNKPASIVVNCAGVTQDSTLLKMTKQKWDAVLNVNLTGVFLVTQAFVKQAVDGGKHPLSVVNVSSIVGKVGNFGQTNYAATKAGVVGFTKSAAKELALKNIRVNAVLPGFIKTPMTAKMPPPVLENICGGIPMGRMGESREIADAVLFLASDMSSYVTGATIEVTGGLHM